MYLPNSCTAETTKKFTFWFYKFKVFLRILMSCIFIFKQTSFAKFCRLNGSTIEKRQTAATITLNFAESVRICTVIEEVEILLGFWQFHWNFNFGTLLLSNQLSRGVELHKILQDCRGSYSITEWFFPAKFFSPGKFFNVLQQIDEDMRIYEKLSPNFTFLHMFHSPVREPFQIASTTWMCGYDMMKRSDGQWKYSTNNLIESIITSSDIIQMLLLFSFFPQQCFSHRHHSLWFCIFLSFSRATVVAWELNASFQALNNPSQHNPYTDTTINSSLNAVLCVLR